MSSFDGFYSILFQGTGKFSFGGGVLVFMNGTITGTDVGGVSYDGFYHHDSSRNEVIIKVTLTVPAGATLVTGTPAQSKPYAFKVEAAIPDDFPHKETWTRVHIPYGMVEVTLKKLRSFPPGMRIK